MDISPSGMVKLVITEAFLEDSGVYTCKASTTSGEAYTSATLRVECKYFGVSFVSNYIYLFVIIKDFFTEIT